MTSNSESKVVPSKRASKILRCIERVRNWNVDYSIAGPDYKRPSIDTETRSFKSEREAYEFAVELLQDSVLETLNLNKNQVKHWQNWNSKQVVRHTLESAKALVKMANEGEFSEHKFSDGYVDTDAYSFKIAPEPFHFTIAYRLFEDKHVEIESATTIENVIALVNESELEPGFAWQFCTYLEDNYMANVLDQGDESEDESEDDFTDRDNSASESPSKKRKVIDE